MLHLLAKILCRAFFKNVYVSGKQSTEPSTIWTANHTSAIVDPALLMSLTPLPLRPIAKHTLWEHPAMKHLVSLARAIPISRLQDMKKDMAAEREAVEQSVMVSEARNTENNKAFQAVCDALFAGDHIMIFAEGISHDQPNVQKLKTGVARMALQAMAHAKSRDFKVTIQPVAIDYFEKDEFRSDVAVHFCEPVIVNSPNIEVEDVMLGIRESLMNGLATFRTWDEKRNWLFIFEMAHGRTPHSAREFRVFVDRYRHTFDQDAVFMARVQTMRRVLLALKMTPCHLIWGETNERRISFIKLFLTNGWFHFLVSAPVQMIVRVIWAVPQQIISRMSSFTKERDLIATMKIAHGLYIVPLSLTVGAVVWAIPLRLVFSSQLSFFQCWLLGCLMGPAMLFLGTWLSEKTDFFRGYWRFASLRFFFPRGWREVMQEWKDISDQCLAKLELGSAQTEHRTESAAPETFFFQKVG